MKQRLNITVEKEVYVYLKHNRKNISTYVEKLILKDLISADGKVAEPVGNKLKLFSLPWPVHLFSNSITRPSSDKIFKVICL